MTKIFNLIKSIYSEVTCLPKSVNYFFSKKIKVFYIGCTGMGNLGDEAIFFGIKKLFKEHFHFYEISYSKPSVGKNIRIKLLNAPKYIFLGGGTIIKKGAEESYLKIFNNERKIYPKAKLLVFGPGVADPSLAKQIDYPTDISAWSEMLNQCEFIAVRGELSKKTLLSWNLVKDIHISHDPALFLSRKELKPKIKQKRIGINFADIAGRIYGLNQDEVNKFAHEIINKLIENEWEIYLYSTTETDLNFMLNEMKLSNYKEIKLYENVTDLNRSLDFLESLDIFLGQRLHSIIFAATTYTPFYAIEYESKTSDFLNTLGIKDHHSRTDQLNSDQVYNQLLTIYKNIEFEQIDLFQKCNVALDELKKKKQSLIDYCNLN